MKSFPNLKWLFGILILGFLFGSPTLIFAQTKAIEIDFFYSETCPHCIAEQSFLDKIEEKYPQIPVNRYSVSDSENQELFKEMTRQYGAERYFGLVPLTFVGEDFFVGFDNEQGMGRQIEGSIKKQISQDNGESSQAGTLVSLPIVGRINMEDYSLPVLAAILGLLDGFNICSLGALALILALVIALCSRSRIILFGGAYILITALIYGFLIGFWYKMFSYFAPYLRVMEILIGTLGIAGGAYFLKQFFKFRKQGPVCEMDFGSGIISKISGRVEQSFKQKKNVFLVFLTVLFFAAVITIVEFPCSAAVPVMFAGLLTKAGLSSASYLFYIGLYLLFYMLDEIIIFLIAVLNMKLWVTKNKYTAWIVLAEAIILFFFGFYYLVGF